MLLFCLSSRVQSLEKDSLASVLPTFGKDNSLLCGAALWMQDIWRHLWPIPTRCHRLPVALPELWQSKMSLDTARCLLGVGGQNLHTHTHTHPCPCLCPIPSGWEPHSLRLSSLEDGKTKKAEQKQIPSWKKSEMYFVPPGFPIGAEVKNLPANAGNVGGVGSIPGSGRTSGEGNGNPLQYSCLENSLDSGAWWATVHGLVKSQTWLSD